LGVQPHRGRRLPAVSLRNLALFARLKQSVITAVSGLTEDCFTAFAMTVQIKMTLTITAPCIFIWLLLQITCAILSSGELPGSCPSKTKAREAKCDLYFSLASGKLKPPMALTRTLHCIRWLSERRPSNALCCRCPYRNQVIGRNTDDDTRTDIAHKKNVSINGQDHSRDCG
jgi:hypothetical protein